MRYDHFSMLPEQAFKPRGGFGMTLEGGSGGGGGAPKDTTSTQLMDPAVAPYVTYGLSEAQRIYNQQAPEYFPGQTYVGPSGSTQAALQAAQTRALQGNPLIPAAQQQTMANIQGAYLGGNPFFQGAFNPAARAAEQSFMDALGKTGSTFSAAGRYGSGAMGDMQDRAMGTFAQSLTDTAGKLAYQNYDAERARQMAAMAGAPEMAGADYADIQRLLTTGQAQEGYQQMALQDAINRYNYQQNLPSLQLQQYLSAAYGSPMGGITTQQVPSYTNTGANVLGGALGGYALGGTTGAVGGGLLGAFL
jgi:hypothetical protein